MDGFLGNGFFAPLGYGVAVKNLEPSAVGVIRIISVKVVTILGERADGIAFEHSMD